jgi:hypothetical protein
MGFEESEIIAEPYPEMRCDWSIGALRKFGKGPA